MGRHSAPDDESDQTSDGSAVAVAAPVGTPGRHARPDDDELSTAPVEQQRPARVVEPPTGAHSTAADFALIRAHGDVRNRVIAAVLVPFALYTAALAALGKLGTTYLLWIWIPLITAGGLVGLFLDLGHRKYNR